MRWPRLFPHFVGLHVERVIVGETLVHVQARPSAASARCPTCGQRSRQVHSRYTRRVADAPLGGRPVEVHLEVRRFRCPQRHCPQRTFAEQVPRFAARRRRRTVPLLDLLTDVGASMGGRPGSRFAGRQTMAVNRMTLIRLVRALPDPPAPAPTVLGVDDFALRRGHRYGTVLVDVAASRIIDLLPNRTAAVFTRWLAERPAPEFICRDRAGEYALGARQGAPGAVQIADRFHLQVNGRQVLERVLQRHGAALQACVQEDAGATPDPPAPTDGAAEPAAPPTPNVKRQRRVARYEQVMALHQQGLTLTTIAAQIGLSRPTVRTYVQADGFPERAPRRTLLRPGSPPAEYLRTQWEAGVDDAVELWQALQARGFRGSARTVQPAVAAWREGPVPKGRQPHGRRHPPTSVTWGHRPPSARQAVWLLLSAPDRLTETEHRMRERLLTAAPDVVAALTSITTFRRIIHDRDSAALAPWLVSAESASVAEIRAFAVSVRKDQAAVQAALDYAWSSGRVAGQVTKIKQVKRAMYGRGKLDLLKRRVLQAA